LWHGASWNFVAWGGYHGALLSIERMAGRKMFEDRPPAWLYPFRAILTAGLVSIGWVFFRAATFADSRYIIRQMFSFTRGAPDFEVGQWLIWMAVAALLVAIVEERWNVFDRLPSAPAIAYVTVMIVMMLVVELLGVVDKQIPFVYFQF
jgi:alginate O-acetyltransferase complex protein AlgI